MSSSQLSGRNFARTMHHREYSQIASATSRAKGKEKDKEEEEGPRDVAAKTIETDLRLVKERHEAKTTRARWQGGKGGKGGKGKGKGKPGRGRGRGR